MLSTASRKSSREKCPCLFALVTIVELLQPTILAILAAGVPAFSIRETAVQRRSWNRQVKGPTFSFESASSVSPFKILAARSLAASHVPA